jgi:hypothetical protein
MPLYTFLHNSLNALVRLQIKWDYKTLQQTLLGSCFQRREFPNYQLRSSHNCKSQLTTQCSACTFAAGLASTVVLGFESHLKLQSKLYCDRRSVGQFVLVSGPFWDRLPDFKSP